MCLWFSSVVVTHSYQALEMWLVWPRAWKLDLIEFNLNNLSSHMSLVAVVLDNTMTQTKGNTAPCS